MVDLRRNLQAVSRLGTSVEAVDRMLAEALDALGGMIPFDLATVMELSGAELRVRAASGPLDGPTIRRHRLRLEDYPSIVRLLERGEARAFVEHDHAEGDGDPFDGVLDLPHGHSCMVVPLRSEREPVGIVTLDRSQCGAYSPDVVRLAGVFGKLLALAMSYGEQSARLHGLHAQLQEQNRVLRAAVQGEDACELVERLPSAPMRHVCALAQQVAVTDTPVLITGETGVGKEIVARAIHGWSPRADQPLVSLNCASLPPGLIESELFGHVRGAFTGASRDRIGRFQAANGGTLFLDEVGELPLELQAKLLRVLQEGRFEPVGSDRTVEVDVRIVAATNVDLQLACEQRLFREDLYYRLAVFPLQVPPLRARPEDVGVIAERVLRDLARRRGRTPWTLRPQDLQALSARRWRGNVRELVNVLERATILAQDEVLAFEAPRLPAAAPPAEPIVTLAEVERGHILKALQSTGGKLYGPGGAADLLGLKGSTLQSRMKKHGLGTAKDYRTSG